MRITTTADGALLAEGLPRKRRSLIGACLAHALHDGYTDGNSYVTKNSGSNAISATRKAAGRTTKVARKVMDDGSDTQIQGYHPSQGAT